MKILDERRTFSVKNKQKGKYVKKQFLVSKRLIPFLNKATDNPFLHDTGTRTLYTRLHKINVKAIALVFETVNHSICWFQWLENIFLNITFAVLYFN